ncbi:MAG: hypothetical protein J4G10_05475 [Alphaproteobacteria bacterium]|nr:hypothetical protein [Alphaproteobacteria bacterium]
MKHLLLVLSNPTEGQEKEFNRWYDELHLDEMLATTKCTSAQRFKLTDDQWTKSAHNYLAVYEVEADDPKDVLRDLNETRSQRQQSPALNKETAAVWLFSEIGPKHEK